MNHNNLADHVHFLVLLGLVTSYTMGGLIRILLVIATISIWLRLV
jgi:hypothetical protein